MIFKVVLSPAETQKHSGKLAINAQSIMFGAAMFVLSGLGVAQETAKVSVNLGKPVNILTSTSFGAPANLYDGSAYQVQVAPYLKASGLNTVRFPGSSADVYHWSTNGVTPYKGTDAAYKAPEATFGAAARVIDQTGSALVVVNYGSNLDGSGGGEPMEAAAWVAYANADASDSRVIGKDSAGHDWGTVGHWATMRSQAPLATDDGYNFLRIEHPAALKIKLWQVGSQVYNNGYYGGEHVGEPDLHAPAPTALKDFGKLRKNPRLSPGFYGDQVVEYVKAMKEIDPSIQIGAAFVTPPDGLGWASDWNSTVLKKACSVLDFEAVAWVGGSKTLAPDYKTMDEDDLFGSSRTQLAGILNGLLYDDKNNCPKGKLPRIAFSQAGVVTWPKVERPVSEALYDADVYALLAESGTVSVTTMEMFGDYMISNDRKKLGPVFYGMQMLHAVAHLPGDQFVDATSSDPKLAIHAVKRRDGVLGLMLVNESSSAAITAKITISGGASGSKARRLDYGQVQQKAGSGFVPVEMKEAGSDFTVTVPAYTITDILIEN